MNNNSNSDTKINESNDVSHLTFEKYFSGDWRKYFQEEETLLKIMDTAGLTSSHDFVQVNSRYLINDDRVAVIAVMKRKETGILDKVIIDVIEGFPSFEQFIDVIYNIGSDCDYHVIICDKNSKNHTSLALITDDLMFQLMDHIDGHVFLSFIGADPAKDENGNMGIHYEKIKSIAKFPREFGMPDRRDFEGAELAAYCFQRRTNSVDWYVGYVYFDPYWEENGESRRAVTSWNDDVIVTEVDIDNDDFAWLFTKKNNEIKEDGCSYDYDTKKEVLTIKKNIPFRNFKYSSVRDKEILADEFYRMANSGWYIEELFSEKEHENKMNNPR